MPVNEATAQIGHTLLHQLVDLRNRNGAITLQDLGAILESVAQTMTVEGEEDSHDASLKQELEDIAKRLHEAKEEIISLVPETQSVQLGDANEQLGAVVKATEDATDTILNAADEIQRIALSLGGETSQELITHVTTIYEACNFQDLTGQRISKVVKTLGYLEQKIDKLVKIFSESGGLFDSMNAAEPVRSYRNEEDKMGLLNGPQMPDSAPSQDDIDALFANLK
jgi:chemotaxis protein CheZ